jgi:hypothetical protein
VAAGQASFAWHAQLNSDRRSMSMTRHCLD